MMSVTEYAQSQGVSRQAVLKKIARGTLRARRIGKYWAIEL